MKERLVAKTKIAGKFVAITMLAVGSVSCVSGKPDEVQVGGKREAVSVNVDWKSFLDRNDLSWDEGPAVVDGPFTGNGLLGVIAWGEGHFEIGRSDVIDHREPKKGEIRRPMYLEPRLPIGRFSIHPVGNVRSSNMRLGLWNAEITGTLITDKGSITWRNYTHARDMAIVVELTTTGEEAACELRYHPAKVVNPRLERQNALTEEDYNPEPVLSEVDGIRVCDQRLITGGFAVGWTEKLIAADHQVTLIHIANTHPETNAADLAVSFLKKARIKDTQELVRSHRDWWHSHYPRHFVSLPDTLYEQFYWMHVYKLASATRPDRMLIDLMGPWFHKTSWPGCWWNLNTQLVYWALHGANTPEFGNPLIENLWKHKDNLAANVPERYRHDGALALAGTTSYNLKSELTDDGKLDIGNLAWALHNVWLQYRYTMDEDLLKERLYPLLKGAMSLYLQLLEEGVDGRLHLKSTYSPELRSCRDANYNLALLRWGCQVLVDASTRYNLDEALRSRWQDVLKRLVDYPVDENGLMVGANAPFSRGHRHYSHLLAIYPLNLIIPDTKESKDLVKKSVYHWHSRGALHSYSYTGASSMFALLGEGDKALGYLDKAMKGFHYNSMYYEGKRYNPCSETPYSAAKSIQDLLMQSWGGTIRVFPAMPEAWKDAAVYNMRTEGAFLVSTVRKKGKTRFVSIKSLAGEPLRVKVDLAKPVMCRIGKQVREVHTNEDGIYEVTLAKGKECVLYTKGLQKDALTVEPIEYADSNER